MDARVTPLDVDRRGIARLTPEKLLALKQQGKTIRLVSRARTTPTGIKLRVRAEVLAESDVLATARNTSSLLLLDTDLMGTLGMFEVRARRRANRLRSLQRPSRHRQIDIALFESDPGNHDP